MKRLVSLRMAAAHLQQFRCFYCGCTMWLKSPAEITTAFQVSARQAKLLQCTAEHLVPCSQGGPDSASNIVAACRYCNQHRHMRRTILAPDAYQLMVARRVGSGRWHKLARCVAGAPNNSSKPTPLRGAA